MAKKEIETVLKTQDNLITYKASAIINKDIIKYKENDILVMVKIIDDSVFLIRENNEYQLKLQFKNKETILGSYLLKKNNLMLELEVLTKELKIDTGSIHIIYELNDEIREYTIIVKE